jgi:Flp pilus assembly protein CpaB
VLGFRQVQRLMNQREVWVASSDLPAGSTIGPQNLKRVKLSESALPKGTLADANAIAGRELSRAKQAGEPFVGGDFQGQERAAAVAEMVPEGRVLTTIRVNRGLVPYQNLKSGDRLDLISNGRVVAHDAYLVGQMVSKPTPPPTGRAALIPPPTTQNTTAPTIGLILALHPEHALPLSRATAGRGSVQVVLHGKTEVASGQLIVLPERYPVEYIAGARRTQLAVSQ